MCGFGARRSGNSRFSGEHSAGEILDKLYAYGDISKDEYEERKKILEQAPRQ